MLADPVVSGIVVVGNEVKASGVAGVSMTLDVLEITGLVTSVPRVMLPGFGAVEIAMPDVSDSRDTGVDKASMAVDVPGIAGYVASEPRRMLPGVVGVIGSVAIDTGVTDVKAGGSEEVLPWGHGSRRRDEPFRKPSRSMQSQREGVDNLPLMVTLQAIVPFTLDSAQSTLPAPIQA